MSPQIPPVHPIAQTAFEIRDLLPMVIGAGLQPGQALFDPCQAPLYRLLLRVYPPSVSRGLPPPATLGAAH